MRITAGGVYVMVQKYGIEGLLTIDKTEAIIQCNPEQELAKVISKSDGQELKTLKVFDGVKVEIRAAMIEFRRTIELVLLI